MVSTVIYVALVAEAVFLGAAIALKFSPNTIRTTGLILGLTGLAGLCVFLLR